MKVELFTTPWCAMCKVMKAKLEGRIEVVDVVAHPERLQDIDLQTVPLLVFWDDTGAKLAEKPGFVPVTVFDSLVAKWGTPTEEKEENA